MATERQIEANQRNAARSTGPRTDEGKARSRANATRHGLAGESPAVEGRRSAEFETRSEAWAAEYRPAGEAARWALDRAVAASLRIERCERAMEDLEEIGRERAELVWDQDRAVEAATVAARLARDPVLVSRQLGATRAGVELLLTLWARLVEALSARGDWSEREKSSALDLLGIPADLRDGRTPIDAPEGFDPGPFRRERALAEVARLEQLREGAMARLDEIERRQAMAGDVALLSKSGRLVLRYEKDAWRRYREAVRDLQETPSTTDDAPAPAPRPAPVGPRPEPSRPPARRPEVAHTRPPATVAAMSILDEIDDDPSGPDPSPSEIAAWLRSGGLEGLMGRFDLDSPVGLVGPIAAGPSAF